MRSKWEEERGESWEPKGIFINFDLRRVFMFIKEIMKRYFILLLFFITTAQAQTSYCGVDVNKNIVPNGGVAKVTLSNLYAYSDPANVTGWADTAGVSRTSNSTTAPDGTTTADTLTATATTNAHYMGAIVLNRYSATATNSYRHSVYVKAGTSSEVAFVEGGDAVLHGFHFNLSTKTFSVMTNITSWGFEEKPNGWFKIFFTYTRTNTSVAVSSLGFINAGTSALTSSTWLAAGTETLFLWGFGAQLTSSPADLIETNGSALTLGPLCPVGYSQSLTDPSRCFIVGPVTSRTIRTW